MLYFHWKGILDKTTLAKLSDASVQRFVQDNKNQGSFISTVSLKKGLSDKNLFVLQFNWFFLS